MMDIVLEQRYVLENAFTGKVVCKPATTKVYYFLSKFHAIHFLNERNLNKDNYNIEGRTVYVKRMY